MDDATVLHACRLLHEALCDDLELRRLVVHVERDRVLMTIHPKHGASNDLECARAIFASEKNRRPRGRYTLRQGLRVLERWPPR